MTQRNPARQPTLIRPTLLLLVTAVALGAANAPPAVGDRAADFRLDALGGGPVTLSQLTDFGPVVLVVLRGYPGYQCPYCTKQVGEFLGHADGFRKAGAAVVFVYPGPAKQLTDHAREFVHDKPLPDGFHLLLDPDYTFTSAYGLRWDAPHETAHPATFVIDVRRTITFAKVSPGHGDRTPAADALTAVASIPAHP